MNSLLNYGSDDDYDDSSEEKQTDWRGSGPGSGSSSKQSSSKQTDANYEEVQMELSELTVVGFTLCIIFGSNDSKPEKEARRSRDRDGKDRRDRRKSRSRRERDRKSRRSASRERRRSRSPRRSRSRDRARKYSKRYERKSEASDKNDRQKLPDDDKRTNQSEGDRFFMPGITGRFRDQIERRKQLWQKKDDPKDDKNGQGKKVWEATTFAQDTDGKVASKFKRLMGIRGNTESGGQPGDGGLRKQEEMFSSMEQQYEVARTATHTMRGVGLGFGSYQR